MFDALYRLLMVIREMVYYCYTNITLKISGNLHIGPLPKGMAALITKGGEKSSELQSSVELGDFASPRFSTKSC